MNTTTIYAMLFGFVLLTTGPSQAAEGTALKSVKISLDQATLQKGMHVFTEVCMGCHSLRYITWRNLMVYPEIGISRKEVDELRGGSSLTDWLQTALSEEDARVSYGVVPPDLSLIARAREGRGAYIYSLLTGFEHDPKGRVPDGNYNLYFPGHQIAMVDPLGWQDHDAGDEADLKEQARAVASFLTFVGDPHQVERQALGKWVLTFLVLLTLVFWLLKRAVWKDIKH